MLAVHFSVNNFPLEKYTYPFCVLTKDISEEQCAGIASQFDIYGLKQNQSSRSDSATVQYVVLRYCAEEGNIDQQVRDGDEGQGNWTCASDRMDGIANFRKNIIRVRVTCKRPVISPTSAPQEHGE